MVSPLFLIFLFSITFADFLADQSTIVNSLIYYILSISIILFVDKPQFLLISFTSF